VPLGRVEVDIIVAGAHHREELQLRQRLEDLWRELGVRANVDRRRRAAQAVDQLGRRLLPRRVDCHLAALAQRLQRGMIVGVDDRKIVWDGKLHQSSSDEASSRRQLTRF
jgi:hypothetical protein